MQIQYIFVEGNIGAGKSTYLERVLPLANDLLAAKHSTRLVPAFEPLDAWTQVPPAADAALQQSHNLFEAFYCNPARYSALFQAHVMQTRISRLLQVGQQAAAQHGEAKRIIILCERSIFTDKHIFVRALQNSGSMSALEVAVYEQWWQFWANQSTLLQHAIGTVYLATPPDTCQQHICQRSRAEEQSGISQAYLRSLSALHDEALANGARGWLGTPCLHIAGGAATAGNFAADDACAAKCAKQLVAFISML